VQAGVDVAIATKMLTLVCEGVLDVLFLVAGDGDFLEALKYIADTRHKKVYLAGFHGVHSLAVLFVYPFPLVHDIAGWTIAGPPPRHQGGGRGGGSAFVSFSLVSILT
jgi:hypothetical protein